jgi:hypothetical protein
VIHHFVLNPAQDFVSHIRPVLASGGRQPPVLPTANRGLTPPARLVLEAFNNESVQSSPRRWRNLSNNSAPNNHHLDTINQEVNGLLA